MLEFKLRFPVKGDAEKLNEIICKWFKGSPKFINNEIIVTPIHTSWSNNKIDYFFEVCIDDETTRTRTICLEAGLMGLEVTKNLVWAVVKDDI